MRRPVALPFHCGTAPEETPAPCVTQSRRERMFMMRLKIAGNLRWNGRPISHAECDRSSQDDPRQRPSPSSASPNAATRSSHGKPNNGSHAAPSTQKTGRPPAMAVPRPRQPKRTNPKHDVEAQGARDMFRASSAVNRKKAREALRACTHKPSGPSFDSVRGLFEPGTCPARPREAYNLKRYPTPRTVSMWLEIWGPSLARMRLTWTSTVREPPQ